MTEAEVAAIEAENLALKARVADIEAALMMRVSELDAVIAGKNAEIQALREPARVLDRNANDRFARPFTGHRGR